MSGYYQCQVIRAAEEGAGVLEAGVHVEVTVTEEGREHQDTLATSRFVTTIIKSSHPLSFRPRPTIVSAANERMSPTRVVEATASEENDSQSDGSNGAEMEDQDREDSYGGEFPSRAEIGLIVSEHMRNIFRQLADIDQRLKFIESRVL